MAIALHTVISVGYGLTASSILNARRADGLFAIIAVHADAVIQILVKDFVTDGRNAIVAQSTKQTTRSDSPLQILLLHVSMHASIVVRPFNTIQLKMLG